VAWRRASVVAPGHERMGDFRTARHRGERPGVIVFDEQIVLVAKPKSAASAPVRDVISDAVAPDDESLETSLPNLRSQTAAPILKEVSVFLRPNGNEVE